MGHDTHFLQRLERLSVHDHLDLALGLYRDSELVRYILDRARLPDGAERVALALEDRPDGPHIIVARSGRFVTCLGENMSVAGLPIVPRFQIDRCSEQVHGLRQASARDDREVKRLFTRLFTSGGDLSREDFLELSTLVPLMGGAWVDAALDHIRWIWKFERAYRRSRYRRLTSERSRELKIFWQDAWALGHMIALHGGFTGELGDMVGAEARASHDRIVIGLAQSSVRSAFLPTVVRAVWMAAHGGRRRVSAFKQDLQTGGPFLYMMMSILPLVGIGLRHDVVRAEVQKTLVRLKNRLDDPSKNDRDSILTKNLLLLCEAPFNEEERALRWHRDRGAAVLVEHGKELPAGHPYRFERPEDVPDDLAFPVLYRADHADLLFEFKHQLFLLSLLPWAVNAPIEQMYLPRAAIEAYRRPFNPEAIKEHLDMIEKYYALNRPVQRQDTPGRNDPCSCGSGKKYKRCCGA